MSLTFPSLLAALTPTGGMCIPVYMSSAYQSKLNIYLAFGFYAGLNILAFVFIFFTVPETMYYLWLTIWISNILTVLRQRTLEELDYIFGVSTRRLAAYQIRTWLPWFFRKFILLQRNAQLKPLYSLEVL